VVVGGNFHGRFLGKAIDKVEIMPSSTHHQVLNPASPYTERCFLPIHIYDAASGKPGGLMSYGPNFPDLYRRAAEYVDKILRGVKPAEIPVEQPTKS
jgi:ABC-type uncharacterized transport system substrate-binding protein